MISAIEALSHAVVILFFPSLLIGLLMMDDHFSFFQIHPISMILAFGLLMSEGLLVSRMIKGKNKSFWLVFHVSFEIAAAILSVIGLATIFSHKIFLGKNHFSTNHGLSGVIVICLMLVQTIGGLCLYYLRSRIIKIGGMRLLLTVAKLHAQAATILYGLAGMTFVLGLRSHFLQKLLGEESSVALAIASALVFLLVLIVSRSRNPASESQPF